MVRLLSVILVAGGLAGLAAGQTVTVTPGEWSWDAKLDLGGLPLSEKGTECILAEDAELDLARATRGIDEACELFGWSTQGEVTTFALACLGDQSADLAGMLTQTDTSAELVLSGDAKLGEAAPIAVSGKATATRIGDCS